MGFELDRLMQQYGAATPVSLPAGAAGRSMYSAEQYQPGRPTVPAITTFSQLQREAMAPGGGGQAEANRRVMEWLTNNPNATQQQIQAAMREFGVTEFDLLNARNSLGGAGGMPSSAFDRTISTFPVLPPGSVRPAPTPAPTPRASPPVAQPLYQALSAASTPQQISEAYRQFVAERGGDTEANRAEALSFLRARGITQPAINSAYDLFKANEVRASSATAPAYRPTGMAPWVQTNLSPLERAAAYNHYVGAGLLDEEVRAMAEKNFGQQTDADWSELQRLAGTLPTGLLPIDKSFTEREVKSAVAKFLGDGGNATAPKVDLTTGDTFAGGRALNQQHKDLVKNESGFDLPDLSPYTGQYLSQYTGELATPQSRAGLINSMRAAQEQEAAGGYYQPGDLTPVIGSAGAQANAGDWWNNNYNAVFGDGNSYFLPDTSEVTYTPSEIYGAFRKPGETDDQVHNRLYHGNRFLGSGRADTSQSPEYSIRKLLTPNEAENPYNLIRENAGNLVSFDVGRGDLTYDQGYAASRLLEAKDQYDQWNRTLNQYKGDAALLQNELADFKAPTGWEGGDANLAQLKADKQATLERLNAQIAAGNPAADFYNKQLAAAQTIDPSNMYSSSAVLKEAGLPGFARGGSVDIPRFQFGGLNDADRDKDFATLAEEYGAQPPAEPAPQLLTAQPPAAQQPMSLESMLAKYMQPGAGGMNYGQELAAARRTAQAETEAFQRLLEQAIARPDQPPSKSELYFRLAAAFADPGKTGSFGEGLGRAAGAVAEQKKAEREAAKASAAQRLQLGLTAQQARMQGAREDVGTLRTLAAEDEKSRRAVTSELLKEWVKKNDPVSTAGKQAQDEGLRPGTPAFQARVKEISDTRIEQQLATINATVAQMSVAAGTLALRRQADVRAQEASKKLTPAEVKLKTETEDVLAAADSAIGMLERAYALNPNTFDASLPDLAQRKVLEAAGSKDKKLLNTRELENLLGEQALAKLKATFGGAPTEGERQALLDLQGLGAKSIQERGQVMKNIFRVLRENRARQSKRLNDINAGLYRDVSGQPASPLE